MRDDLLTGIGVWPRDFAMAEPGCSPCFVDAALRQAEALLPELASGLLRHVYLPLSIALVRQRACEPAGQPLIVSVSGWPGAGKSTLVRALTCLLEQLWNWNVASLSLDDVHLTRAERQHLAKHVHPLLATRGVPGTHDVGLALDVVQRLQGAHPGQVTALPRFDKRTDDRVPSNQWPCVTGRPDVVLLDGWFWGAVPAAPAALQTPCNPREANEDPAAVWRTFVNAELGRRYPELFGQSCIHVHLHSPAWQSSVRWRLEQERALYQARGEAMPPDTSARVERFMLLFERIARLPRRTAAATEFVLVFNDAHAVVGIDISQPETQP